MPRFILAHVTPTITNRDEIKDTFCEELDPVIDTVSNTDKLIILGEFNARVGCGSAAWEGVVGKYDIGNSSSNGVHLLYTYTENGLLNTNTASSLLTHNKML